MNEYYGINNFIAEIIDQNHLDERSSNYDFIIIRVKGSPDNYGNWSYAYHIANNELNPIKYVYNGWTLIDFYSLHCWVPKDISFYTSMLDNDMKSQHEIGISCFNYIVAGHSVHSVTDVLRKFYEVSQYRHWEDYANANGQSFAPRLSREEQERIINENRELKAKLEQIKLIVQ